jgi:hypothetical protein
VNRLKSIPYYHWSRHGVTDGLTGAGGVARGVEQAEIKPPFRIMPSRQRNLVGPGALALLGLALFAWGIWSGSAKPHGGGLEAIALVVGVFLAPIAIFWLVRERRYFDPRNEYYIEIGIDEFALVTPDATDRARWRDLAPFEVKQVVTHHHFKHGHTKSVSFETVTRYGALEIKIPLDDFATRLGLERRDRAEAMRTILDDLRQRALVGPIAEPAEPFLVPAGLVVAPMPSPNRSPVAAIKSVVQRK